MNDEEKEYSLLLRHLAMTNNCIKDIHDLKATLDLRGNGWTTECDKAIYALESLAALLDRRTANARFECVNALRNKVS